MRRMMMAVAAAAMLLAPAAFGQNVSYEKYQLDNGMTVILHQDRSLPVACVNIWYHVGSKDEQPGRSGFAHLFEHLMFMGTERVPGLDFDNIMESGGGHNNATTSEDRTNYFEIGPASLLPTLLWLEADRLEALGRNMTTEKLDLQRDVVRNERRQSYENQPYGKAELKIYELMFPKGHPYHIPVIGTHEDLEAATVHDVKSFFATYYVPNNASMVVAGDFDPEAIKPLIAQLFGTLPRGDDVLHRTAEPVKLADVVRYTATDQAPYARTMMVYHSPALFAEGDAEMDLAAAILSDGITSRLYQKLVYENELAVDVAAYQSSMLLGSLFYVQADARPGVELDQVEAAIDAAIAEFTRSGPTAEELERQKAKIEYGIIAGLQSLLGKADRLNMYNFHWGEPNSFARDLDRYRNATVEGVKTWAGRVLTPDARLVLRILPIDQPEGANPRDSRPELFAEQAFLPAPPVKFALSNGLSVTFWHITELPMMAATMLIAGGSDTDGATKSGRAYLVADMLDEGAGQLDALQFADALDALGAHLDANVGYEFATVDLSVLSRNFEKAVGLMADAVIRPRLDDKEWQRVQSLHAADLKRQLDNPTAVAVNVAMRSFFGAAHPYGLPTDGTIASVESLTLDDIQSAHAGLYQPSRATLFVAGNLPQAQVTDILEEAFGAWKPSGAQPPASGEYAAASDRSLRVLIVDKPGAVQTVVRFVMPGPVYATPNRIELESLNTILGGSFTSRLNRNLREDKGYTYGARSAFAFGRSCGYFTAYSSVRADVTGPAIKEFLAEFAAIRKGDVSDDEATKARSTRRAAAIESLQGLRGVISAAVRLAQHDRPFTDLARDIAAYGEVTDARMNALANESIPLEKGVLVLVGDKSLIREHLADIDLPAAVEVSVEGEPLSSTGASQE